MTKIISGPSEKPAGPSALASNAKFEAKAVRSAVRSEVSGDKVTLSSKAAAAIAVPTAAGAPKANVRLGGKDDPRAADNKVYKAQSSAAKVARSDHDASAGKAREATVKAAGGDPTQRDIADTLRKAAAARGANYAKEAAQGIRKPADAPKTAAAAASKAQPAAATSAPAKPAAKTANDLAAKLSKNAADREVAAKAVDDRRNPKAAAAKTSAAIAQPAAAAASSSKTAATPESSKAKVEEKAKDKSHDLLNKLRNVDISREEAFKKAVAKSAKNRTSGVS